MFFDDILPLHRKQQISPETKEYARQLSVTIYNRLAIKRVPNLNKWSHDLELLLKDINQDVIRFVTVLHWYCLNAEDKYTPHIHSAAMFRQKFGQIEAIMKMREQKIPVAIIITPAAEAIVERLRTFNWPKNFGDQLPSAVQTSIDNYVSLLFTLEAILSADESQWKLLDFIVSRMGDSASFVQSWFEMQFNRVVEWSEWSGSPASIMFRVDSPLFERQLIEIVKSYTGSDNAGVKLLQEIKHESSDGRGQGRTAYPYWVGNE